MFLLCLFFSFLPFYYYPENSKICWFAYIYSFYGIINDGKYFSTLISTNCTWNIKNCFHLKSRSPYLWYSPWIVCALWFFSLNILRQASQTRLTFSLKFLGWLWVILSDIYTAFIFEIAPNFLRIIFQTPQIYKKSATIYVLVCNKTYPLKLFDSQNPT